MDQELEQAIDAALDEARSARPSPDFLPRLRAHVEQLPPAPIRWWIPFAASGSAIAAGVIVAALVRAPQWTVPVRSAASDGPVAAAAPRVDARAAAAPPSPASRTRTVRRQPRVATPSDRTEVMVPPGQLAAIGRLLDAINAGDEQAASAIRRLGTVGEIVIEPIQVDSVAVAPLREFS